MGKMGKKVKDENSNPWSASSIYDFYYFCCPECDDKSKSKQDFVNHALYHIGAVETLQKISDGSLNDVYLSGFPTPICELDIKEEKEEINDDSEPITNDFDYQATDFKCEYENT